jgi:hypothetical protein
MKKIVISAAMLMGLNGFAQIIERKKIVTGTNDWSITQKIVDNKDTSTYFYYSYQNMKYKHIVDLGDIFFSKQKDLIDLANALKILCKKEKGSELEINMSMYKLNLFDFSERILITDKNGKYILLDRDVISIMADEFLANAKLLRY